jgi:mediator of RNA polymerase II transcription subunit 14
VVGWSHDAKALVLVQRLALIGCRAAFAWNRNPHRPRHSPTTARTHHETANEPRLHRTPHLPTAADWDEGFRTRAGKSCGERAGGLLERGRSMPGILIMDHSGSDVAAAPRDGENKKRNCEGSLINGNGARKDPPITPNVNGANAAVPVAAPGPSPDQYAELPPEIAHIPTDAYHTLSTLLLRISQDTYNDLTETLQAMAEVPLAPQMNGVMTNGTGPHAGAQESAEANRRKKLLLMKFAQDNRAKFIKLLVLTEWGSKAALDVSKLIDLFAWAREQQEYMDFVDVQVERIKLYSSAAAERNPDIATALAILSTGKASWVPTLDYIPPEPVSSDQALKLLRYMNTSLSIRLNVHETLPRRLRNWRIHSGRVTFVIENELEFDVVSFVEDASDQWWFIDLRFLFSPAPSITVGSKFFNHLKVQGDFVLQEQGLAGLFDFLNNFILTHKISVLRSQVMGLARAGWAGSMKIEPVHRELVVQYWIERPGKKNWIEIGVDNNKLRNGKISWRGPPIPSLAIRWFRSGQEVKEAQTKSSWQDLSFERTIKHVIAQHIRGILQATQQSFHPTIAVQAHMSNTEPADCKLRVTLGPEMNTTTLSLEPVTGNYLLQPATVLSAKAESAFNQGRDPKQIAYVLTQLLSQTLRELVHKHAQQLGWHQAARQSLHIDVVKAVAKLDVLQYVLYTPRGWSSNWSLAAVIDASGVSWWAFEIAGKGSATVHAEKIELERPDGTILAIDCPTLTSLERVAVQLISTRVTARQLEHEGKSYTLRSEFGQTKFNTRSQRVSRGWALYLQTVDLLTTNPGERAWLEPNLAIVCHGLRPDGRNVWHIAAGRMVKEAAADMQKLMAASPQSGFKFADDGSFRILLSTPFGHDVLSDLRARLRDVNRLRSFATTIQKRGLRLGSSSLQRVQFQYASSCVIAVYFTSEKEVSITLSANNPHYRVRMLLTEIANERIPTFPSMFFGDSNGLDRLCSTLVMTRPVLSALKNIETQAADTTGRNPAVHVHSIFKYRLTYENPVCTFDVRTQTKDDKVCWFIEDNWKHTADLRPAPERTPGHQRLANLQAKLKTLYSGKGARWYGTRNGLIAELDGVPAALKKLNDIVLSCKMEGGYKVPTLSIPVPAPQPQPQAQPHSLQQQQQQQQQQQARAQQARQQQAQNQAQARKQHQPKQPLTNLNQRVQMPNGRQQHPHPHPHPHLQGPRPGQQQPGKMHQQQDIIEID